MNIIILSIADEESILISREKSTLAQTFRPGRGLDPFNLALHNPDGLRYWFGEKMLQRRHSRHGCKSVMEMYPLRERKHFVPKVEKTFVKTKSVDIDHKRF